MDPLSQGVLGASLPQSLAPKKHRSTRIIFFIGLLGFFSGMAADLDILIHSSEDPLLFLEYHRQFTHSLVFIPIGSFLCATFFYFVLPRFSQKFLLPFKSIWLYCALGYGTHGLLDSCTSYGTQLFWPFSNYRVAWNTISIIDPLFTLPILILIVIAAIKNSPRPAQLALTWALLYMLAGLVNQYRAEQKGWELAKERNHEVLRMSAKPTFGNIILWKVIYETEKHFHMDPIRTGIAIKAYYGDSLPKLNIARDYPWLDPSSQQARDIERFAWFSQNYVAVNPEDEKQIIDTRYSPTPNRFYRLWGIELSKDATATEHVKFVHNRTNTPEDNRIFREMIFGK